MEQQSGARIFGIVPESIAEELELTPGDLLLSINGEAVQDLIDYRFASAEEYLELEVAKADGEVWVLEIEKETHEDLGLLFEEAVFDRVRPCCNKCVFCFVDQMPPGMRSTLYVKDDDYRLSFLQGNFITLTNLKEEDIQRIIRMRLSPLYVSVHAFDPTVRTKALNNKQAGKGLEIIKRLVDAGIQLHTQVVLVPELNDREVLTKTVTALGEMYPGVVSLAVVPVGLTKYRDELVQLNTFDKSGAKEVLATLHSLQVQYMSKYGTRFVFASDEFYLTGDISLPGYGDYEEFNQLENGVGLVRLLWHQVEQALEQLESPAIIEGVGQEEQSNDRYPGGYVLVTGVSGAKALQPMIELLNIRLQVKLELAVVVNNYFGSTVTVTGLLTGQDILATLTPMDLVGKKVLLPQVVLRQGEPIFLDDMTLEDFCQQVTAPVEVVEINGEALVEALI